MRYFFITIWLLSVMLILAFCLMPGTMAGRVSKTVFSFPWGGRSVASVELNVHTGECGTSHSTEEDPAKPGTFFDRYYYQIQWTGHVLLFFLNSWCFLHVAGRSFRSVLGLILWVSLVGSGLEWAQGHLPDSFGRTGNDWKDLVANYLGMGLAILWAFVLRLGCVKMKKFG